MIDSHKISPPLRRDIAGESDVAEFVRRFYRDVAQDELLGPLFNETAKVDWASHLPKLTSFWCRNLFASPGYEGNTLRAHLAVHRKQPFTHEHFDRWLMIFDETLDLGWSGPVAERARQMARRISEVQRRHIIGKP